jgi:hypothetical protein
MIHVVVMKCLVGLPLLIHIEVYEGVGVEVLKLEESESVVFKIEESQSEVLKIEESESVVFKIEESESVVFKIEESESKF